LRDYGIDGQIGLEETPEEYVQKLVDVFGEVRRVLREDGTLWLVLGDSYVSKSGGAKLQSGFPQNRRLAVESICRSNANWTDLSSKNLIGIPWRVAFALQAVGWILRSDIIWAKPNPMPESVKDRPTKAHEYVFLFAKSQRYFYNGEAIKKPYSREWNEKNLGEENVWNTGIAEGKVLGRKINPNCGLTNSLPKSGANKRSVWIIPSKPFSGAHFACFPPALIEPMIKAGCPKVGTVLDPFFGAGTTGLVAQRLERAFIGIELNRQYADMAYRRIVDDCPLFTRVRREEAG